MSGHRCFILNGKAYFVYCVITIGHLLPRLVQELDYSHQIVSVAAGLDHSVALTSGGMVFTWGDNSEGQCGLGHRMVTVRSPTLNTTIQKHNLVVLRSQKTYVLL